MSDRGGHKRALVIAPQPFFTPRGTPFSVYYRTMVTAELGVEIDLLTYGQGRDVDLPGVRILRIPDFPFLGAIPVGPSLLKLFLDALILLRVLGLLVRHRYDFVHAHEEAVFFCRFLQPIFGFKLVYDMHSSLPQQLDNFQFTRSRVLVGLFRRLEDSCLRAAHAVITICPELAEQALTQIDDPDKHFLIENSIFEPIRFVDSAAGAEMTAPDRLQLPSGRQLIVYAGTLESYQGIELLFRAFAVTLAAYPSAYLVVVGGTPEQVEHYSKLADQLGLADGCLFSGRVDPGTARAATREADILVSPRVSGTNTPLKIYEQLASGKPLVATAIRSHTQVLTEEVAFLAPPKPQAFAEALNTALSDPQKGATRAAAARRLYERDYSRSAYVSKMRALFDRLGLCAASSA